jgi:hypothetical protein
MARRTASIDRLAPALRRLALGAGAACVLAVALARGAMLPAQAPALALPFAPGEELHFRGSSARLGSFGGAVMKVAGPEDVRGQSAYVLSFDFDGRVGLFGVHDHTRSWMVPRTLATLRYRKDERSPMGTKHQAVEIMPEEHRWHAADGTGGALPAGAPADELSFMYLIRTLPLADAASYSEERHYDLQRNPVVVRVVGRSRVTVPAGQFDAIQVEMRVKDPTRYRSGVGVIRIDLTDDARRMPLRIVSSFPVAGSVTLVLTSYKPGTAPN